MTRSMNSVIFAVLRQSARIRYCSLRTVFLFVIMTVPLGAHASAATNEAEARALFTKFVAAQNAHSVPVVFTRGLPGQPSQDKKFLVTQTLVHDANGWHIVSIISIPNAQLK